VRNFIAIASDELFSAIVTLGEEIFQNRNKINFEKIAEGKGLDRSPLA
jgi:hypothetical protein